MIRFLINLFSSLRKKPNTEIRFVQRKNGFTRVVEENGIIVSVINTKTPV